MNIFAKIIRVLTVASNMALVMLVVLFIKDPSLYGSTLNFILSIAFLVLFPLLAYPLQPLIRKYKDKGREGQRTLAMIFAVLGYIGGCVSALILRAPKSFWLIYLSYLISVLFILMFNKLFHLKASGHACGVTGPFAILVYFGQLFGYIGIPILAAVWWASIHMKRHTSAQLICGAIIPILSLCLAAFGLYGIH